MADEKLNTGPAENISPEAAEPITTPEQAAASEPQQEQTGPAIPLIAVEKNCLKLKISLKVMGNMFTIWR